MVVERKSQKALVLLGLASGPLPNAVKLSVVPTELAAEPTTKMKSLKANLVTNFLPSTKKTTEYSFDLFSFHLQIFDIFFLKV